MISNSQGNGHRFSKPVHGERENCKRFDKTKHEIYTLISDVSSTNTYSQTVMLTLNFKVPVGLKDRSSQQATNIRNSEKIVSILRNSAFRILGCWLGLQCGNYLQCCNVDYDLTRVEAIAWLEAMATRFEAIATKVEAIATRVEAIAIRVEAIARLEAIATRVEAISSRVEAITTWHDLSNTKLHAATHAVKRYSEASDHNVTIMHRKHEKQLNEQMHLSVCICKIVKLHGLRVLELSHLHQTLGLVNSHHCHLCLKNRSYPKPLTGPCTF